MASFVPIRPERPEPSWHGMDPTVADEEHWQDPFPRLAEVRERAPVHETPAGLWRVMRWDDCFRVLREIPAGVRRRDGTAPGDAMGGNREGGSQFMLGQDPPTHTRLRKLVSKAFTPRATEAWRPRIREVVNGLIDDALEAGEVDLIQALALPVPSQLICEMLGVPVADRDRFTEWTALATHGLRGSFLPEDEREKVMAGFAELSGYFQALIAERRADLQDDLLSVLIRAEEEGDRLSPEELLIQSIGLLVAGFETTIGLIGLGAKNFCDHPAEADKLRQDPGLIANAVEECLRYEGPIGMTTRVLHADAEIGGFEIPADTTVWVSTWSANRDPARHPAPERFDVSRADTTHLGFGAGTHMCLGAHLARAETQEALGALVGPYPDDRAAGRRDRVGPLGVPRPGPASDPARASLTGHRWLRARSDAPVSARDAGAMRPRCHCRHEVVRGAPAAANQPGPPGNGPGRPPGGHPEGQASLARPTVERDRVSGLPSPLGRVPAVTRSAHRGGTLSALALQRMWSGHRRPRRSELLRRDPAATHDPGPRGRPWFRHQRRPNRTRLEGRLRRRASPAPPAAQWPGPRLRPAAPPAPARARSSAGAAGFPGRRRRWRTGGRPGRSTRRCRCRFRRCRPGSRWRTVRRQPGSRG